ncbi:MAG: ComEC/Rec2 family competence protein [Candidatus Caccovivens sp.]
MKFNKTLCINVILIAILVAVFCFLFFNSFALDFYLNGFGDLIKSDLQVYFLDVGQASASVIIFPNDETMLIDCGSESSKEKFVSDVSFILNKNHLSKIDYLLLTHSDEDHVGGAVELLERFEVKKIFRPKLMSTSELEEENIYGYKTIYTDIYSQVITAVQSERAQVEFVSDMTFSAGESVVSIYSCQKESYSDVNSYSPFVFLQYGGKSFLFTGDATSGREKELITSVPTLTVDFLQVAHHGSNYSTTDEFLSTINARYAFISAGDQNHPSQNVIQRLSSHGVEEIYISKLIGLAGVGVDSSGIFYIHAMVDYFDYPLFLVLFSVLIFTLIQFNINFEKSSKINRFRKKNFLRMQI